jgi:hypothetical protein
MEARGSGSHEWQCALNTSMERCTNVPHTVVSTLPYYFLARNAIFSPCYQFQMRTWPSW